ncbi:MAG: PIN domain-containing protein [Candidatus Bathyarchaeota archaeon]|nr:PIN domain-containing protein [Candidatus Bathyarchaeota archaeon]
MSINKLKVYLDTNVFIFGVERPESNSRIILDLVEEGKIVPVVSYSTLEELREYFSRRYNRETAINEIYYLISLPNLEIITRDKVKQEIKNYKGVVPDKDLPHLVSAIIAQADYLVSYNRHFIESKAKNYIKTVKQADVLKLLGIEPQTTGY